MYTVFFGKNDFQISTQVYTFWEITGRSESLLQINLAVIFLLVLQLLEKHGRCW